MALPEILAGPIVRRATINEINIWICTSTQLDLSILVYKTLPGVNGLPFIQGEEVGRGAALRCLRLGAKLYVYLLKALPDAKKKKSFDAGELLAYDIKKINPSTGRAGATSILTASIRAEISLTGRGVLPTIVLQKNKDASDLRALYSSCRKLHGAGNDAFVGVLQTQYKQPYTNLVARPNALFLIGDQIYADDVSGFIINRLQDLSEELIGFQENVPDKNGGDLPKGKYARDMRQKGISDPAGFTSTAAANHLARFGEFAAMYLLSWSANELLWQSSSLLKKRQELSDFIPYVALYPAGIADKAVIAKTLNDRLKELDNLLDAKAGSAALRKIMANTPTYMIFDDHDVTDDWNFTPAWKAGVEANPLGRTIVANAIAVYTAFQAWGNDPDIIGEGTLLDNIEGRFAQPQVTTVSTYQQELFKFEKWSFLAPTTPVALFVDSRTRREMSPVGIEYKLVDDTFYPRPSITQTFKDNTLMAVVPALIGNRIVAYLNVLIGSTIRDGQLILVTPGPVFDIPYIDNGITIAIAINHVSAVDADAEGWLTNKRSFLNLMDFLFAANPAEVIMLSGDVHYAFSASGTIQKGAKNGRGISFSLLNSSAAKNMPTGKEFYLAQALGSKTNEGARKLSFYIGINNKQQTYFSAVNNVAEYILESNDSIKEFYQVAVEFSVIPATGSKDKSLILTACNVGYFWIDSRLGVISEFITSPKRASLVPVM